MLENLKCASCGSVLVSGGSFTGNLVRFSQERGWGARPVAECACCGYEEEPVPFESSEAKLRPEKPPEIVETRVAGFRSWKVNLDGQLTALHRGDVWMPGENRASCPTHGSQAPVVNCKCGFSSFYRFDEWRQQEDPKYRYKDRFDAATTVCGIASASGRTVLHETGWHARVARVEALIAYRTDVPALGGFVSVRPLLEAIAKRYGVPVISPDEAEMFCSIEGLELMEPMVGAESEVDTPKTHLYVSAGMPPAVLQQMGRQTHDLGHASLAIGSF